MSAYLTELPRGTRFIGPNGDHYEVTTPASEDPNGWVFVRNLSMTDAQAQLRGADPGCDPRDGFFAFSDQVEVQVLG